MASQTLTQAINNLVQKQNQTVVEAVVQEVRADGQVFARVGGISTPVDTSATDQPFVAGMTLRLVKNDRGGWVALGGR